MAHSGHLHTSSNDMWVLVGKKGGSPDQMADIHNQHSKLSHENQQQSVSTGNPNINEACRKRSLQEIPGSGSHRAEVHSACKNDDNAQAASDMDIVRTMPLPDDESEQDDLCSVIIKFTDTKGQICASSDVDVSLELSVWLHIKTQENEMETLKRILKEHGCEMTEQSGRIELTHRITHPYLGHPLDYITRPVTHLFKELSRKYIKLDVDGSNECKKEILNQWPTTQLYKSHKATAHRTHSGKLCIATTEEYATEVRRELKRISDKNKKETDECPRLDSTTSGHTLPDDRKTLEVPLTDPQFQLLESQQEAWDYVVSCLEEKKIDVTFVVDEKKLILETDVKNENLNDQIIYDCIWTQTETLPGSPPLDIPVSFGEGHSAIKGKYMVIPDSTWKQVTIVATRDIVGVVQDSLGTLLPVIVEKSVHVSTTELEYLSTQNHWELFEPVLYVVNGSKSIVSVRSVKSDSQCSLFVRGTQRGVEEFENEIRTCLSELKVNSPSVAAKQKLLFFLQSKNEGLKYVETMLKERGLTIKVGEKDVIIRGSGNQNITYESLKTLILSKAIYKDDCELLELEEMKEMLLEKKEVHQEKLMVDIDRTNECLALTGTADIFPAVLQEVADLVSKYALTEDQVCISTDHKAYIQGIGQSKLKAMVDNPRLKVKLAPLDKEPGFKLLGSKVGVTTVKTWLQLTSTATGRKATSQNLHAGIAIKGHMQKLLKQSSHARQVVKQKCEHEDFEIDFDAEFGIAKIHVKHEMHLSEASKVLSTVIEIVSFDLRTGNIDITPTLLKTLLLECEPRWAEDVIMDANDSGKELTVCSTIDVIALVENAVKNTLPDYEHETVFLPLDYGAKQSIRMNVNTMFKSKVSLFWSSERVEITGARIQVQHCLVYIGKCLTDQKPKQDSSPKLQVCELVISPFLKISLEQNPNIRSYLETKFDDCGYAFALHHERLKLCAGSITALSKVWNLFLSHICEMKLSLGNEPVVKLFGINHMCEKIANNQSYQGKVMTSFEEKTGLLSIVCTEDVKDLVEESLLFHKKMCVQSVIDIDHEKPKTEFDLKQVEDEVSQALPDIKGMFKLHVENGKICVVAVCEHMKEVKTKIVQLLAWKQREAELITTNPYVVIPLSDFEYDFLQKPQVINYIDDKLKNFSFGRDLKQKSLRIYGMKRNILDQGVKDLMSCLIQDELELHNDPLLENCTLGNIKDMLDIQEYIHGGKLLVRIYPEKSSLVMLCTDDVHDAVLDKFQHIKQTCSDVTHFIELSKEKWDRLRFIYPEDIDAVEKENVRIEHDATRLSISGHSEVAAQVKRKLESVLDKMYVRKFSFFDEMGTLQTDEGQKLLTDTQKNHHCVIELEKYMMENSAESAVKECLAEKHLRLTHGCVRLFQWIKNGSSISVIQGRIQEVNTRILVVPTVGGKLPEELRQSLQEDQDIRTLSQMSPSRSFSNPTWCKCSSCVFLWIPECLKENKSKEKETVRKLVKDILRKAAENTNKPISCVFVLETLYKTGLQAHGVKCIVRGIQEAFKELKCSLDVQLLTDKESSNETLKILTNACSDSKKINLLRPVEMIKKKMSLSKGKPDEVSKPSLKIVVGALEKQKVDVLVITCHHSLDLSEGVVSKVLNDVSHGQLQQECRDNYPHGIQYDELAITNFHTSTASKRAKVYLGVIRVFSEDAGDDRKEENWKMMYEFIYHCLYQANQEGAESIAFPAIGCGKLGYPNTRAAEVMFNTVEWFFNIEQTLSLKNVHFVLHEKDKNNIKVFSAEKMARSYHVKSFIEDASTPETRHDCGDIMLQIIGSSLDKCEGTSDGLLCFWNKHQLTDSSQHPTVGKHLEQIDWYKYASELTKNDFVLTRGGGLPATRIIHTFVKSDFKAALFTGLKSAVNNYCQTVQVELAEDLFYDSKALVADLQAHLKSRHIARHQFCLLTVLIPNPDHYKSVVSELKAAPVGLFSRVLNWSFGHDENVPAEEHSGSTDNGPQLVVSGASDEQCEAAYQQVLDGIKQIQAAHENSSSPTERDDSSPVDFPTPHQDSSELETEDEVFGICRVKLKPFVTESKDWVSIKRNFEEIGLKVQSSNQQLYAEGSFSSVSKAHELLCKPAPKPVASGLEKGSQQTGPTITVSDVHFEAVLYFIGKAELERFCNVEEMPSSQKKIWFSSRQEDQEEVLILQQRIQGVIQDAVELSTLDQIEVSKQKAHEVEKSAMSTDKHDVYIKYEEDKHVMIMFTEDWNAMSRAKKRIMLQLGQGKVASRGKRRFANQSDTTLKSSGKQNENTSSFAVESGVAVAEGQHFTVKVYKESIVTLKLDVIVNAANGQLRHGGGVARIIANAAGQQLLDEGNSIVLQKGDIPVTDLAVTNSGNLACQRVFHAVGPRWSDYINKDKCLEDLCCTILRCLCEAVNRSFESIAFTSISSSIFGVPKESCAKMYVRALKSFDTAIQKGSLKEVHFVDVSDVMVNIIQSELRNSWTQPVNQENLAKDRTFIMKCLDSSTSASVIPLKVTPGELKEKDKNAGIHWLGKSESISLRIVRDDILKIEADSILSWVDTGFSTTSPSQKLLDGAGGDSYRRGRDKAFKSYKSYGEIAEGTGGSLPQKNVIFAVAHSSPTKEDVSNCLKKALDHCVKHKLTSLILIKPPFAGADVEFTFIETTVDRLIELDQDERKTTLHVQIVEKQKQVVDGLTGKLQQYLSSCGLTATTTASKETESSMGEDCVICCNEMPDPVKLKCGHQFCQQCVDKCFKIKAVCPVCKMKCGVIRGNMPIGSMRYRFDRYSDLPGFKGCGTIVITYMFNGGYQKEEHPEPGKWYRGITRTAYLPGNAEGQKVLSLLRVAWERRLTFTIGRSVTMGLDSCITWNEIHHKTNRDGGPTNHGYPDSDYLRRVQEELADQGITEEYLGATPGSTGATAV